MAHIVTSHRTVDNVSDILASEHGSVHQVGEGLNAIAAAAAEQERSSEEMRASITAIAAATEANHAALKQTSQAAQTLDALAESLRDSVSRFKA